MVVAKYVYDAWDNHAIVDASGSNVRSGIGVLNPFRYCGYFYDEGTDLYYLQTRYYDPETGRFISQDNVSYLDPDSINGLNLYAYYANNPVMNVDPTGTWELPEWLSVLLGGLVGVGTAVAIFATGGLALVGGIVALGGYMFLGANSAYESAKALGYSGWSLFGYTLTGLFVGNYVVASNWDYVIFILNIFDIKMSKGCAKDHKSDELQKIMGRFKGQAFVLI